MSDKLPNPRNLAHGGSLRSKPAPAPAPLAGAVTANWPGCLGLIALAVLSFALGWFLRGAL